MMRILLVTALLLSGFKCSPNYALSSVHVGHWEGTVRSADRELEASIDLSLDQCTYDIPALGIYGERLETYYIIDSIFKVEIAAKEAIHLKGSISGDSLFGTVSGLGSFTGFIFRKVSRVPEQPVEEEVSFRSGAITLYGTLIKPKKSTFTSAIILIHGSAGKGKMTRDLMRNRGMFFAKHGVAALIYDRRGNGKSEGDDARLIPMEFLARDAASAVDYLASRTEIDPDHIGVFGLSQGAWVAPYVYQYTKNADFIIVVSAPGITPDEQNEFVVNNVISNRVHMLLKNSETGEPDRLPAGIPLSGNETVELVPGFSHFDPLQYWKEISLPVLALWGDADRVVPAEQSKMHIEHSMSSNWNPANVFRIFPHADHQLKLIDTTGSTGKNRILPLAKGSQELMIDWIRKINSKQ